MSFRKFPLFFISQRRRGAEIKKRITNNNSAFFAPLREIIQVIIFICCCCFLISCSSKKLALEELTIERDGQVIASVKAEIARTQEEQAAGLMFRENLPDGEGMFFIFENDRVLSFWMKNTLIPLSIAYITFDGRIVDIRDMYPHDETRITSSRSVRYALEVPQGWFSRAGVREGDIVKVTNIK